MTVSYALKVDDNGTLRTLTLQDLVDVFTEALGDVDIKLGDIDLNTDGIEALATALNGYVDNLEGSTDGLEGLATTLNGLVTTLNGYVDTLETKLTPPLSVETGAPPLTIATTRDANEKIATYTQQRATDNKTRVVTVHRTPSGAFDYESATAWS